MKSSQVLFLDSIQLPAALLLKHVFSSADRAAAEDDCGIPDEDELGVELALSAGDVVLFGSNVYHRSGANLTAAARRVYYAQFSGQVITAPGANKNPLCFAVKCV